MIEGTSLADLLLAPTRIYVNLLRELLAHFPINAMAHITGGGFLENIPRVLPDYCRASIETNAWKMPAIFEYLAEQGGVEQQEMYRTFNCGIGMVLVIPKHRAQACLAYLHERGENAWQIGHIKKQTEAKPQVELC